MQSGEDDTGRQETLLQQLHMAANLSEPRVAAVDHEYWRGIGSTCQLTDSDVIDMRCTGSLLASDGQDQAAQPAEPVRSRDVSDISSEDFNDDLP